MAKIDETVFRKFVDGQDRITAQEYMREREVLRQAINDAEDKLDLVGIENLREITNDIENLNVNVTQVVQEAQQKIEETEELNQTTSQQLQEVQATVEDLRISGTGIDAQARLGIQRNTEQMEQNEKVIGVKVESFGAIGDGRTDDGLALKAAHEFANSNGYKVNYDPNKTYYISNVSEIVIRNDVDFNNSTIIIDDTFTPTKHVYKVVEDVAPFNLPDNTIAQILPKMKKNVKNIPELAGYGDCYVSLTNTNKKQYIKIGEWATSGTNQSEFFMINNNGDVLTPIDFDFESITSMKLQPIAAKVLVISRCNVISKGNYMGTNVTDRNKRGFLISRSNVDIENITHTMENNTKEVNPSVGLIEIVDCGNIRLNKVKLVPKKVNTVNGVSYGTYDLTMSNICGITFEGVEAFDYGDTTWGFMQGDRIKNFYVKSSKVNRIDSHMSIHNLTIEDTTLGYGGLTINGFGTLSIKNLITFSHTVISLRNDMGAFWDGDILLENIKHHVPVGRRSYLFYAVAEVNHDFGYPTMLGNNLVSVKNYTVFLDGSYNQSLILIDPIIQKAGLGERKEYTLAKNFIFENIQVDGQTATGFILFEGHQYPEYSAKQDFKYSEKFVSPSEIYLDTMPNVNITCKNVDFHDFGFITYANGHSLSSIFSSDPFGSKYSEDFTSKKNRLLPKILIENCNPVFATVKAMPIVLEIKSSLIRSMYNYLNGGSRSTVRVENSTLEPLVSDNTAQLFRGNRTLLTFVNCTFKAPKLPNDTYILDSNLKTVYEILQFGSTTNVIYQWANLTNCTLDYRINIGDLKTDIFDYGYVFGNHSTFEVFPRKRGTTTQRPPESYVKVADNYFDRTIAKQIVWNGSAWVDHTGASV